MPLSDFEIQRTITLIDPLAGGFFRKQLAEALKKGFTLGVERSQQVVNEIRTSEAGEFKDLKCRGQRGEDRSTALYDAYQAIRKELGDGK